MYYECSWKMLYVNSTNVNAYLHVHMFCCEWCWIIEKWIATFDQPKLSLDMNGHIPMYELALSTDKLKQTNKKGYSFLFHGLEGAS